MNATKVNSMIALLRPPVGEALPRWLDAAVKALKLRSDAELARDLGIPPATLASWKRRGSVSQEVETWFEREFVRRVLSQWHGQFPTTGDLPVMCVLELYRRTACNPWRAEDGLYVSANATGGLIALANFLLAVDGQTISGTDNEATSRIADILADITDSFPAS